MPTEENDVFFLFFFWRKKIIIIIICKRPAAPIDASEVIVRGVQSYLRKRTIFRTDRVRTCATRTFRRLPYKRLCNVTGRVNRFAFTRDRRLNDARARHLRRQLDFSQRFTTVCSAPSSLLCLGLILGSFRSILFSGFTVNTTAVGRNGNDHGRLESRTYR